MRTILSLAIALFAVYARGADLLLVDNGRPNAVIVAAVETNALRAAAELQKYIKLMSGADLPILHEGARNETGLPVAIAVGRTQMARKAGVRMPTGFVERVGDPRVFEEEGFAIKTARNAIYLGGNDDGPYQGTFYAVYELLERLGCRWYFPGDWGEVVPERKSVAVPEIDLVSRPDFALRHVSLGGWIICTAQERAIYDEWCRKVKFSRVDRDAFYPIVGDGFLAYLVPPREFQEDNPTLYAMNQRGSRTQPLYENIAMLSLVNTQTFNLAVQNLKEAFDGKRKMSIVARNGFGISPPDGAAYDHDPEAVKRNQNFDYPTYIHHPQTSEEFFDFASRLARVFPNKWAATMAYAGREMPPQGVAIPPNLSVLYAPISTCVLHAGDDPQCWRRQETIAIMRQWLRLTPHVYLYDYNPGFLLGMFIPERDVANFARNVKLYRDMKLKGFLPEGRKAFMQTWISYYMRSRLMWDAGADIETLKRDFYTTFFGPAAGPHVQAWWDACEAALGQATIHCHEDWLINHVYTVPFTIGIKAHVDAARAAEMTAVQRERFEAFALIADHLEAFAAMEAAESQLDYVTAARQAQRMEDDKAKLIKTYSFFMGPASHSEFSSGRIVTYTNLATRLDGSRGRLVAAVPMISKFTRDRFNEGVIGEWYAPTYNDASWGEKNTFLTWDAQDKPEDACGHDYDGYGWYRFTVDVPSRMVGKRLKLYLGGIANEGWVWVNGNYAGHRPWYLWWAGRNSLQMEVDVTGLVKSGPNVIAIRVWNNAEIGGLYRRGFLWTPSPK